MDGIKDTAADDVFILMRIPLFDRDAELAAILPFATAIGGLALDDMALATEWTDLTNQGIGAYFRDGGGGNLNGITGGFLLGRFFGRSLLAGWFLLQVLIGRDGDMAVAVVGKHLVDDIVDLGLEFGDELSWIIFFVFDIAEFLFPDTRQCTALEEFLVDGIDEFDTRRCSYEVLSFTADIMSFEQSFDDTRTT